MVELNLLLAVLGGVVSFLSPCVLPLVPAYVTFITGASLDELTDSNRKFSPEVLRHALLFIAGFSLIFVLMGASASFIGGFLITSRRVFEVAGGIFLVLFGLLLSEIVKLPWAMRDWRVHMKDRPAGNLGTLFVGMVFAFGWTPCIGPILGGIYTLAAGEETPGRGMLLLGGYSFGLALPFVLAAVGLSRFLTLRRRIGPWLPWIQRVSGIAMVIFGALLITGQFTRIAAALAQVTPDFLLRWM
ncbi:MAG: cytochrome c biogenesis CcdA family protein [Gemmatimonadota bacterium]